MRVCHGLAGGFAMVDADAVAIRVMAFDEDRLGPVECLEQGGLLHFRDFE